MGPGRELYEDKAPCNWVANGWLTPNTGWVGYLKGLVEPIDDVTPHHYGVCNIYQIFGDAVYVTALATAVCKMTSPAPHALTTSWVSLTMAGGLSNAPGAERLPDGKTETLWHMAKYGGKCGDGDGVLFNILEGCFFREEPKFDSSSSTCAYILFLAFSFRRFLSYQKFRCNGDTNILPWTFICAR